MIRNIERRYFEVWGSEEAQNVFLKGLLAVVALLFITQSVALALLAMREPTLVAIGTDETRVFNVTPPPSELLARELKRQVWQYVQTHYTWDEASIEKAHAAATRFVSPSFIKAFLAANADQIKFAKEKRISQRVYMSGEIQVDPKALTTRIPLDRVFRIDGIRATSPLTLDVSFEYGPRTEQNPEGIYITGEKATVSPPGQGGG